MNARSATIKQNAVKVPPKMSSLRPQRFTLNVPEIFDDIIKPAENELALKAEGQEDQCWGYFPDSDNTMTDLPASKLFSSFMPQLEVGGQVFGFSFLRLSLTKQHPRVAGSLHIDANTDSGVGDYDANRQKWQAILNLSTATERTILTSSQSIGGVTLEFVDGLKTSIDYDTKQVTRAVLPVRETGLIHGIAFCASHMLHGGEDAENGHFISAFSRELE
jgi:hypothetical protein